jgi:hypothetical protein
MAKKMPAPKPAKPLLGDRLTPHYETRLGDRLTPHLKTAPKPAKPKKK